MSRVIAVDLDGVLIDFNSGFAKVLKQVAPTVKLDVFDPRFPAVWGWPAHYGYTGDDEEKAWREVIHSSLFWKALFPYATAIADLEYLNQLQSKHDIYFVTTRPGDTAKQQSEAWLRGNGVDNPTVVICGAKAAFCTAVHADIIIDDKPENLLNQSYKVQTALFKRPYNEGYWDYFNKTVSTVREALADVV